jgi:hypothetical protein
MLLEAQEQQTKDSLAEATLLTVTAAVVAERLATPTELVLVETAFLLALQDHQLHALAVAVASVLLARGSAETVEVATQQILRALLGLVVMVL